MMMLYVIIKGPYNLTQTLPISVITLGLVSKSKDNLKKQYDLLPKSIAGGS